jgi:hypothetical protein
MRSSPKEQSLVEFWVGNEVKPALPDRSTVIIFQLQEFILELEPLICLVGLATVHSTRPHTGIYFKPKKPVVLQGHGRLQSA